MSFNDRWKRKQAQGKNAADAKAPTAPNAAPRPPQAVPLVEAPRPTVLKEAPRPADSLKSAPAEEPRQEKAPDEAQELILFGTVPRIRLGMVMTGDSLNGCEEHGEHGYVWGLGRKPKPKLAIVKDDAAPAQDETPDDGFYAQLREAKDMLERHALAPEEGPYADKDGRIGDFTGPLLKGLEEGDLHGIIDRLIGLNPFIPAGFSSIYNESFMAPDALPTAGEVLSQHRLGEDRVTGAKQFIFAHPMEMYVVAAAVLREKGYQAYPAQAIMPHPDIGEIPAPLMVILDLSKEVPLTTFDLFHTHPHAGAIDILSDTAVMGALYAELAEMRTKHFTVAMFNSWKEKNETLPDGEITGRLESIARALFESAKRWDGNQFIPKASDFFLTDVADMCVEVDQNMALPDPEAEPVMTHTGMRFPSMAEVSAKGYGQFMLGHLSRMIAKAKTEEET